MGLCSCNFVLCPPRVAPTEYFSTPTHQRSKVSFRVKTPSPVTSLYR